MSNCGRHVLSLKKDLPFDMPHPNREGGDFAMFVLKVQRLLFTVAVKSQQMV